MSEVNHVLDRSGFEKQTSENDTESKEHFQAQIRSTIRPEQCGQNDQSNTINDTAKAMQSKRYDQRYDQDKPGVGNGYIASNTYAKTKDLPNVQEVDVGR